VTATRLDWQRVVLPHAQEIVLSYDTAVTLRQLFYRLVADGTLPNLQSYYTRLSAQTAEARRTQGFPDLLDQRSRIRRATSFDSPTDALTWLSYLYRRDRTEGQEWSVYLGVEKNALAEQLHSWYGDLGLPSVVLGGFASQSYVDKVRRDVEAQGRPAILIYAGDFDPSGDYIDVDLENRVGVFDKVQRIALDTAQVLELNRTVPFNLQDTDVMRKLERDPRHGRFVARHRAFLDEHFGGKAVQFEVDALPPETLRNLYRSAIDQLWDADAHAAAMEQENADLVELRRLADSIDRGE
jgi:hypothetical protein